jgi:hypothetical protein
MTQHFILDINAGVTQNYKENIQDVLIRTDASEIKLDIPMHEANYTVYPVFNLSIKYEF